MSAEFNMFKDIPHGLYRIWFADCEGVCLAAVGSTHDGTRWYAPCNWTSGNNRDPVVASTDWSVIRNAELIEPAYGESEEPGIYTRELTAAEVDAGDFTVQVPGVTIRADEWPSEEGKRRYTDEPVGFYDSVPCECKPDCPNPCKGACGCDACALGYGDYLSSQGD